jgi:hypothetical protein
MLPENSSGIFVSMLDSTILKYPGKLSCLLFILLQLLPGAVVLGQSGVAQRVQVNREAATAGRRLGWDYLRYAIYFTYPDIQRLLVDSSSREETLEYLAPIKARKVYLECSSRGTIDIDLMKSLAADMRARGYEVTGAMVPVVPDGPICYNNPDHLAHLEKQARALAEVFDEFILDDWLFTICTCEKCIAGRGTQSWADYRTKLILEKSKQYIIDPARKVRPGVKIIIKYPNWYEGHRQNGYDVYGETNQFDAMAVGIETRTRATHDQHIPIYSGYVFQKWWSSVDPSKWIGSWLDNYTMKGQDNDYVAQVWQAVLAQTPEIILWSGGHLHHTGPFSDVYPHFREMLPEFDRVAGILDGAARGVPMYLPYGSVGEYNIFGYFGMAGIPIAPVAKFPKDEQTAIFTKHSLQDPGLSQKMLARLQNGHDVYMTWSLLRELQNTDFINVLNVTEAGGTISSATFRTRIGWNDHVFEAERPFAFPRIETTTWPYAREVAVVREDNEFGVLFGTKYLNGMVYVLNMPENSYDLLRLPPEALNMIRRPFTKELGVELEGPGGVGIYLFGNRQYVLYNMSDETAHLSLRFIQRLPTSGWHELVHGKLLEVSEINDPDQFHGPIFTQVALTLDPFEIAVVESPAKE